MVFRISMGGNVFTYDIEGEPSSRFLRLRSRAVEDHLVFDGDEYEGEFCKRFPHTCMEIKGLYSIDDGMMSVFVTEVPEGYSMESVDDLFRDLLEKPI